MIHLPLLLVSLLIFLPLAAQAADAPPAATSPTPQDWPLEPFWQGHTMFAESALALATDQPGQPAQATLAFTPTKILEVKSADGQKTFQLNKDYTWDGSSRILKIPAGSTIPTLTQAQLYLPKGTQPIGACRTKNADIMFAEGTVYHHLQFTITYEHQADGWHTPATLDEALQLPNLARKFHAKEPLNLVVLGDSISSGCNSSGMNKTPPFQPPYPGLVAQAIQKNTGCPVTLVNLSVGGKNSAWGATQAPAVAQQKPDLVILAFGMNDATPNLPAARFVANIQATIDTIRKTNPNAEFILVAPMTGNPDWISTTMKAYPEYASALWKLRAPGLAVADVTTPWTFLLERKKFADLTGNGVNHPNDFGHRVYAQVVWSTILRATDQH